MTKKDLNQNAKYDQELINIFDEQFIFDNKPINRFNNSNNINTPEILSKPKRLSELKKEISSIEDCNLKDSSNSIILGDGDVNSPIIFIGEAPGVEEERSGKVFQGEVGALLKKMLAAINIKKENVYLSYSINYRPPEDRKPTAQEIKRYSIFLKKHISIINPKIIVLMGSTAMEALVGLNSKITHERGKWKEIILNKKTYPIMITFNPSYLIRFPENKKFSWEDLKKIRQKIKELNIKI